MAASAWVFQNVRDLQKNGPEQAKWYVGWYDPDGKRRSKACGSGWLGKKNADDLKTQRERELDRGEYIAHIKKTWGDFRQEYDERIGSRMGERTRRITVEVLAHFERLIKPKKLAAIKTQTIDDYIGKRKDEPGRRKGDTLSPFTLNKELRHLRAVLRVASEWDYLPRVPKFRMVREPGQLITYVVPEHFEAIYRASQQAKLPADQAYPAADWWRGLLIFAYMTGWRIGEILALRREDVDQDAGTATTWHEDNKGKRDERVKLHPVVQEHLKRLPGFSPLMFPWNHNDRTLYDEFARIQAAAGIRLPCRATHEHTASCHVYGFHDLRRAFATVNANRITGDALQKLMRHKSYQTTQRYINMASQLDEAVAALGVPEFLKVGTG
jgi:integrase